MPLHSIQTLSPTAVLGLWHLTETADTLWSLLPQAAAYRALLPAKADITRQSQWLAGRVLVHRLLAENSAWSKEIDFLLENEATGRPYLAGAAPDTVVSLSHSGEWVAALLATEGRAGVDVEIIRDKAQRLAVKFLSPFELAHATVAAAHQPMAYYSLLWSAKETLYKLATRRGIIFREQLLLAPFELQSAGTVAATLILAECQTRHHICYFCPAPGYVLTYSHESGPATTAIPEF